MAKMVQVKLLKDKVVNGSVYFAGASLPVDLKTADGMIEAGEAEIEPKRQAKAESPPADAQGEKD